MPVFIQTTDRLLNDPELLKEHQMDIQVVDKEINNQISDDQPYGDKTIQMVHIFDRIYALQEIGVGVYDILNEDFDEKTFKPSSTVPIVRLNGLEESSEESADSDLFYEFNSESEN